MRIPSNLPKIKTALHISQAVLVVLSLILTIAVYATSGSTDGRTAWYFVLCWVTPFLLAYQALVPAFPRTRRFSNIYAFATIDGAAAVLWLSAWAAVTDYVVSGKGHGSVKDKSGCDNFKYGSSAKCSVSEATIFFGVAIMLLFIATAVISAQAILEYQRTGILPNYQAGGMSMGGAGPLGGVKATGSVQQGAHADDEAFDSNMNSRNDWDVEEYDHEEYHDRYGGGASGHDARQGGYSQAAMDDHGDDEYEVDHGTSHQQNYNHGLQASGYRDDHDLGGQRPASTGPGPLGGDTSYHAPSYGQGNTYGH